MKQVRPFPSSLRAYWVLSVFLAAAGRFSTWVFREVLHRPDYPFGEPIFPQQAIYADYTCFIDRFRFFHTSAFFDQPTQVFNYPAPVALVYKAFYHLHTHGLLAFLLFAKSALILGAVALALAMIRCGVRRAIAFLFAATVLLVSFPVRLELFLANMEIIVWVVLTLAIAFYASGHRRVGSILFGVAGSMKIYPVILLGAPLSQRRWKDVSAGVLAFAVILVGSMAILGPTIPIAARGLSSGLREFSQRYVNHYIKFESGIDHSLFELVKLALVHTGHSALIASMATPYLLVVATTGLLLYIVRIRRLSEWHQLVALTILSVLLPPVSHDYTLLQLYAPWALVVIEALRLRQEKQAAIFLQLACFAVAFAPLNFVIFQGVRYGGEVRAIALTGIVLTLLIDLGSPIGAAVSRGVSGHADV